MHEGVAAVISHGLVGWYPLRVHPVASKFISITARIAPMPKSCARMSSLLGYWKMKWWDTMLLTRLSGRGKIDLCNSETVAEEVRKFFGYESRVVALMANRQFVPLDQMECRRAHRLASVSPRRRLRRITPTDKNFGVVRALIQALPEVHWVLALPGRPPREDFFDTNIRLLRTRHQRCFHSICGGRIFPLPFVYESFGYVVAEALACGTPVSAAPGGAARLFLSESST